MDVSDGTCFESEVTVRENPVVEQAEHSADIVVSSNDNVIISTDSDIEKGSMSAVQLQELLATLMQTIQSEISKQTAALEAKLTAESSRQSAEAAKQTATLETKLIAESNKQSAESAKQTVTSLDSMDSKLTSAIEKLKSELRYENEKLADSLIARSESEIAAIREECNAKISSEIRVVADKIDRVSRDAESKITSLNNTIESVRECMNDRINAHVVQARKETDRQGQEITAASSSLLASIKEHKEQIGVTVETLNQEISKSREYTDNKLKYVDSKFSTISEEIQDIKQHSSADISRLGITLADLQAKLMAGPFRSGLMSGHR